MSAPHRSPRRFLAAIAFLYQSLCVTLALIALAKLLLGEGSWINYLLVFLGLVAPGLAARWLWRARRG